MSFFKAVLDDFEVKMRDYARQFEGSTAPCWHENGLEGELDKAFKKLRESSKDQEIETIFRMVEFNHDDHYGTLIGCHKFKSMFYAGFSMPSFIGADTNNSHFMAIGCHHNGLLEANRSDMDIRKLSNFDLSLPSTTGQEKELDNAVFKAHLSGAGMAYPSRFKWRAIWRLP